MRERKVGVCVRMGVHLHVPVTHPCFMSFLVAAFAVNGCPALVVMSAVA